MLATHEKENSGALRAETGGQSKTVLEARSIRYLNLHHHSLFKGIALLTCFLSLQILAGCNSSRKQGKTLRAGAYAMDITPTKFPIAVNGGFEARFATHVVDRLHARCLVLDDGKTRLAIAVVDSVGLTRDILDQAKEMARAETGIPTNRMLISSTHTHSAPASVGALGTEPDLDYARLLPGQIAQGIEQAVKNLAPAKVGWAVVQAPEYTHCRRWITRPDKVKNDPFGQPTVRAMMHPGYQNPDFLGPSGPVDAGLSLLSIQSPDGHPIALLANYSQHYFGAEPVSADYYGKFAEKITHLIGADKGEPAFVGIMSQGTSGDLMWMDYSLPKRPAIDLDGYANAVAERAYEGYKHIEYHDRVPLEMAETTLTLGLRLPSPERLAWAKQVVAHMPGPLPKEISGVKPYEQVREVYAREQVLLVGLGPTRELKLQAIRIGDLGIAAIPNEVFGITGLEIKAFSPLKPTFTIELANGAEGYIPPPEQHKLGGYTTWAARSAGLEVNAAPKIASAVLGLLSQVSGKPLGVLNDPLARYDKAVLASGPAAFWRMHEFHGPETVDASGKNNPGAFEDGVVFYLEGPPELEEVPEGVDRAALFAGGRAKGTIPGLGSHYSVEMWFYNELPVDVRGVTGYLLSRGPDGAKDAAGDHLGIGGRDSATGKLFFSSGREILQGKTQIAPKTWYQVAVVRDGKKVLVYLNGKGEISGEVGAGSPPGLDQVFIGGGNDNVADFYGKICEVSIYNKALSPHEAAEHYLAIGRRAANEPGISMERGF
jgi:hypothetical protein